MGAKETLDLDTDPRAIIGVRIFNAPRALVFEAWRAMLKMRKIDIAGLRQAATA